MLASFPHRPARIGTRLAAFVLAAVALPASAQGVSEVTLDASPQLFTVLCALRAAGKAPVGETAGPVGPPVQAALARLDAESLAALQTYFEEKRQGAPQDDLTAYVSTAMLLRPPPEFEFVLPRDQLPPDAWELAELPTLLRDFYARAQLDRLWRQVQPAYESAMAARQAEVAQMLLETRAYLRLTGQSSPSRTYTIYLEWLVPPSLASARNYGDTYFLILHPERADFLDLVRHQYLHFLLDPIALEHAAALGPWERLQPLTERAARLPAAYRRDLLLLATESLIQAIELRLRRAPPAETSAALDRSEQSGFLFTRHFYYTLELFEHEKPSIRFYFPDLIRTLDVDQELARLEHVDFSAAPAFTPHAAAPADPLRQWLGEAEAYLAAGNQAAARERFERVLAADPGHPGALFGLAVLASQAGDRQQAKEYFERTLERAREPRLLGWTHIYLGRILDLEGERQQALEHYRAALALNTRLERVEQAARRGLERPFGQEETPKPEPKF